MLLLQEFFVKAEISFENVKEVLKDKFLNYNPNKDIYYECRINKTESLSIDD